jgi:hypothetical protein
LKENGMASARSDSITLASGRRYSGPLIGIENDVADADAPMRARTRDAAPDLAAGNEPRGRRQEHVHVYLPRGLYGQPAQFAPRLPTHDAVALPSIQRPPSRRDQAGDPEPGALCAKLMQSGETGEWGGADAAGRPLVVSRGDDGSMELRYAPPNGDEDPDKLAAQAPSNATTPDELTPGRMRMFEHRMSAALAPGRDADQRNPASLRGLQALLSSHYARR